MKKQNNIRLIQHHQYTGSETMFGYLIIFECEGEKIINMYKVEFPSWHKFFDSEFKYYGFNFN